MSPISSTTLSKRVLSPQLGEVRAMKTNESKIKWKLYPSKEYARKGRLCFDTHFRSISGINQNFTDIPSHTFANLKSIT